MNQFFKNNLNYKTLLIFSKERNAFAVTVFHRVPTQKNYEIFSDYDLVLGIVVLVESACGVKWRRADTQRTGASSPPTHFTFCPLTFTYSLREYEHYAHPLL